MKPVTETAKLVAARIEVLGLAQKDVYERLGYGQGWWWLRMNTNKPFPFSIATKLAGALSWSVSGAEARRLEAAIAADHGRRVGAAAPYVNHLEEENRRLRAELEAFRSSQTPPKQ